MFLHAHNPVESYNPIADAIRGVGKSEFQFGHPELSPEDDAALKSWIRTLPTLDSPKARDELTYATGAELLADLASANPAELQRMGIVVPPFIADMVRRYGFTSQDSKYMYPEAVRPSSYNPIADAIRGTRGFGRIQNPLDMSGKIRSVGQFPDDSNTDFTGGIDLTSNAGGAFNLPSGIDLAPPGGDISNYNYPTLTELMSGSADYGPPAPGTTVANDPFFGVEGTDNPYTPDASGIGGSIIGGGLNLFSSLLNQAIGVGGRVATGAINQATGQTTFPAGTTARPGTIPTGTKAAGLGASSGSSGIAILAVAALALFAFSGKRR